MAIATNEASSTAAVVASTVAPMRAHLMNRSGSNTARITHVIV